MARFSRWEEQPLERDEYRKRAQSFSDALRASLAAKRGLTIEDLQKQSEEPHEGEGEAK
jgi:hypothetical protein